MLESSIAYVTLKVVWHALLFTIAGTHDRREQLSIFLGELCFNNSTVSVKAFFVRITPWYIGLIS